MKDLTATLSSVSALEDDPSSQGYTPVANRTRGGRKKTGKEGDKKKRDGDNIQEGATGGTPANTTKRTDIEEDDISSVTSWVENNKKEKDNGYSQADFINAYITRARMDIPTQPQQGKKSQPYYYIKREGVYDDRERFKCRDSLTFHEFLLCYNNMLRDKNAGYKGTVDQHLLHMSRIIEDSMHRPWPLIRRWANKIFDEIDDGFLTWDNDQEIENLRNRMVGGGGGDSGEWQSNQFSITSN